MTAAEVLSILTSLAPWIDFMQKKLVKVYEVKASLLFIIFVWYSL